MLGYQTEHNIWDNYSNYTEITVPPRLQILNAYPSFCTSCCLQVSSYPLYCCAVLIIRSYDTIVRLYLCSVLKVFNSLSLGVEIPMATLTSLEFYTFVTAVD